MNEDKRTETRYSRQTLFAPIGSSGQAQLAKARVGVIGMGALGTVLANHMVRAGVGYVRLIDRDFVEMSNLQRQMLYDEEDARLLSPKVVAAAAKLSRINSQVELDPLLIDLNPGNAEQNLADLDLILDGTDNFTVRFLINDVAVKNNIPWIYGGAVSSQGTVMTIIPAVTPCLRCMFGQVPPQGSVDTCDTAGVIAPVIHVVASYQATEALKLLVGSKEHLNSRMIHLDLWLNHHAEVQVSQARKSDCPACSQGRFDYLSTDSGAEWIQSLCGRDSVQIQPVHGQSLNLEEWALKWEPLGKVERNPFLLKLHLADDLRLILFADSRMLVQGTQDPNIAKSLYSRYVGM